MTVAEMKLSNRERLNKLEALDPKTLNDILDNVFSKYFPVSKKEEIEEKPSDSEEYPSWFGMWKENGDEIKQFIYECRNSKKD